MKKYIPFVLVIAFVLMVLAADCLLAQDTTIVDTISTPVPAPGGGLVIDVNWLLNAQNGIYAGLTLLLTYLSSWLPGLKRLTPALRALSVGGTLIAGFVVWQLFGSGQELHWREIVAMFVSFLLTTLTYDKTLKPVGLETAKTDTK